MASDRKYFREVVYACLSDVWMQVYETAHGRRRPVREWVVRIRHRGSFVAITWEIESTLCEIFHCFLPHLFTIYGAWCSSGLQSCWPDMSCLFSQEVLVIGEYEHASLLFSCNSDYWCLDRTMQKSAIEDTFRYHCFLNHSSGKTLDYLNFILHPCLY